MFRPYRLVAAGWEIAQLLSYCNGVRNIRPTLQLGHVEVDVECGKDICIVFDGESYCISREEAERTRQDEIYMLNPFKRVEAYSNGSYVKLRIPRRDWPPTIEINGIHMHRIEDIPPTKDALLKVLAARVSPNQVVLDIGTGLGYTAIESAKKGARVLTIEVSENVLWAAERNPYSWQLENKRITIVLGDATEILPRLPDETFDRIIHDPPRYSIAGELYSLEFYRELYRVLKPGGILYHYTGEPGRHSNISILGGVKGRLKKAGFVGVKYIEEVQGFIARRPRRL